MPRYQKQQGDTYYKNFTKRLNAREFKRRSRNIYKFENYLHYSTTSTQDLTNCICETKLSSWQASQWLNALTNLAAKKRLDSPLPSSTINYLLEELIHSDIHDESMDLSPRNIETRLKNFESLGTLVAHSQYHPSAPLVDDITKIDMTLIDEMIYSITKSKHTTLQQLVDLTYSTGHILTALNKQSAIPRNIELLTIEAILNRLSQHESDPSWPKQAAKVLSNVCAMLHFGNPEDDRRPLLLKIHALIHKLAERNQSRNLDSISIGLIIGSINKLQTHLPEITRELIKTFKVNIPKEEKDFLESKSFKSSAHKIAKCLCLSGQSKTCLPDLTATGLEEWLEPHIHDSEKIDEKRIQHRIIKRLQEDPDLKDYDLTEEAKLVIWRGDLLVYHRPSDQYVLIEIDGRRHKLHQQLRSEDISRDAFFRRLTRPDGQPWLKAVKRQEITPDDKESDIVKLLKTYILDFPYTQTKTETSDAQPLSPQKPKITEQPVAEKKLLQPEPTPAITADPPVSPTTKPLSVLAKPFIPQVETRQDRKSPRMAPMIIHYTPEAIACYSHAQHHERGSNGFLQDDALAYQNYQKAASFGHRHALYDIGRCLENGIGVRQNRTEAMEYYKLAERYGIDAAEIRLLILRANGGEEDAQYLLGCQYLYGDKVAPNPLLGIVYLLRSAERNYPAAAKVLQEQAPLILKIVQDLIRTGDQSNIQQARSLCGAILKYGSNDPSIEEMADRELRKLPTSPLPLQTRISEKISMAGGSPYMAREAYSSPVGISNSPPLPDYTNFRNT